MATLSRVRLRDNFVLDGLHKSVDGYLAGSARVARTGTQVYKGSELERPDLGEVTLYRPESEVFHQDAMHSMAHRPVTLTHPPVMVDAKNWSKYAKGQTGDEVVRDGDCIRVPMVLMDHGAIEAVLKGDARELSMGYTTDIDWTPGTTPQGEKYDAVQTNIRGNHLAVVPVARGGARLRFGDAGSVCPNCGARVTPDTDTCSACGWEFDPESGTARDAIADRDFSAEAREKAAASGVAMSNGSFPIKTTGDLKNAIRLVGKADDPKAAKAHIIKRAKAIGATSELPEDWKSPTTDAARVNQGQRTMTATVIVDGVKLEVADQVAASVIEKYTSSLIAKLADAEKKMKKDDDDMEDAKKANDAAIKALKADVSTRDGQIAVLTKQVKDAEVTPEKLTAMVADRAALVKAATPMLPKDFAFDAKSDDDIRKAAVTAKLGDAAKDFDAAAIGGAFKALALVKDTGGNQRLAGALNDSARARDNVALNDAEAAREAAYSEMVKDQANAWKTPLRN